VAILMPGGLGWIVAELFATEDSTAAAPRATWPNLRLRSPEFALSPIETGDVSPGKSLMFVSPLPT
jgi:hypothetical protein